MTAPAGEVLWEPPLDGTTAIERFGAKYGFADYDSLYSWSVTDLDGFWAAVWDWCGVLGTYDRVLSSPDMPGATDATGAVVTAVPKWFEGATLNYAEHALRGQGGIIGHSQTRDRVELSADELRRQVAACRAGLQRLGVGLGDRVVAYLPNIPETIVAFLATASLGAIWSSAAPEFGPQAVIDRFGQIEPKVLFTVDGYMYGDKPIDRSAEAAAIAAGLPTVEHVVTVPYLHARRSPDNTGDWADLLAEPGVLEFAQVAADHPLHVLYSSGTTGLPKAIVHSHSGIVVEHLKMLTFHFELTSADRFLWFTTTGWMMWNFLVSGLLTGTTIVTFDGDPGADEMRSTWRVVADEAVTWFGTSAPFIMQCRRLGVEPGAEFDLSALRAVGSTGAPLPVDGFYWVDEHVKAGVPVWSSSGGTDICSGFVGGSPTAPVRAGEISVRNLGAAVEAVDGELVVTKPMPSMPVRFWGDDDGSRYRAAYFDERPGVWTHGDLLEFTKSGGLVIGGRSDATLNRGGVRIGTAEIYRVVESLPEVTDSLVVHHEDGDRLILFVAAEGSPGEGFGDSDVDNRDQAVRDDAARDLEVAAKQELKNQLSPRHVPNEVYVVAAIPTTLSGKKLEIPVKRILAGAEPDDVASRGSLRDPAALDAIAEVAAARNRRLRWDEASRAFAGEGEEPRRVSPRREELLEIAAELFAQQGFAAVTVDGLGAAAGVSGPALYHHFDSKEAMLGEMLVGTSHHLLTAARALYDSVSSVLSTGELLVELIAIHVDFAVDHRALISVEHRDLNNASAEDQERVRSLQGQYVEIWVGAVLDRHPALAPAVARAAVHGVLGMINSTPLSPRVDRVEMVGLLRDMAAAAFDAVPVASGV
ncbi:MAG TPA: acetoacetate--CoA ligase [Ilumatobacter sp.]|nr:acetoacetate--CoA ligase [Ilumatobacter sp.]